VSVRLEGLDAARSRLASLAQSLGESWSAALRFRDEQRKPYPTLMPRLRAPGPQPTNLAVIEALKASGRDVFALDEADRAAIVRDGLSTLDGKLLDDRGALNSGSIMLLLGGAWRRRIVARLEAGAFKQPSQAWTERKIRLGLDARPLNASHQLVGAIRSAQITVHRTR